MLESQLRELVKTRFGKIWTTARFITVVSVLVASLPLVLVSSASAAPYQTVTFAQNDNPSDSVVAHQTADTPTALTLFAGLTPAFSNPGYTFVDWNTQPDGSGTSYSDGETFDFSTGPVLYAIWSGAYQTVTFAQNDNPTDAVKATQTENAPTALTLFSNLSPAFSNPGYTFAGWNTEANGSGTAYSDGQSFSFLSAPVLYAQWSPLPTSTLTFSDNGGVGSEPPLTEVTGISITLPNGTGLAYSGYTFAGWNTQAGGTGTEYTAAQSLDVTSSETLYAQWSPVASGSGSGSGSGSSASSGSTSSFPSSSTSTSTSTVTVSFVANGGSGSLTTMDEPSGANVTLPSSSSVVRVGYTLTSWNTEADGKGASFKPGASFGSSTSVTLYAQWTSTGAAPDVLYGAIGDFVKNSTTLSASLEHQVRELASVMKAKHYTKVKLYGYTAATGLATLDRSLSDARASKVASYLRDQLRSMNVADVSVEAAGEGSVAGKTSSMYSRVEVFVS
jgi:uncharacterized repeat protein (TIGR02543 family)